MIRRHLLARRRRYQTCADRTGWRATEATGGRSVLAFTAAGAGLAEGCATTVGRTFIIPMNTIPNAIKPKTTSIIAVKFPVTSKSAALIAIASQVSQYNFASIIDLQ
jgi:hypothetical protein